MLAAGLAYGGKYFWMAKLPLEYKLTKMGNELDSAAHGEYVTIINEHSLRLIDLSVDILRRISEE